MLRYGKPCPCCGQRGAFGSLDGYKLQSIPTGWFAFDWRIPAPFDPPPPREVWGYVPTFTVRGPK